MVKDSKKGMMMATPVINWQDKVVWIIGASYGIGRSLAQKLAEKGAFLALSGRTKSALDDLQKSLSGNHLACSLDITDMISIENALQAILKTWQRVDVVISAAGIYHPADLQTISIDQARETLNVNLLGPLGVLKVVMPQFKKQGQGQIALVASVVGYSGLPRANIYGASKAGLNNLCEVAAMELMASNISVRVINPGFVVTRMTEASQKSLPLLITTEAAADYIIEGFKSRAYEIHFPKVLTYSLKLLRMFPSNLYFKIIKKLTFKT
jgi:short-subunit dehydrogenase